MIPFGIHTDVDVATYHQKTLGTVSKSALDRVQKSPAHYRAWLDGETKVTPALEFGRAFHCAVLEPNVFAATHVVKPDFGDCRAKANKANRDAWIEDNAGKLFVDDEDFRTIVGMAAAVAAHPAASRIMADGIPEITLSWEDPVTGLPCKSRADYYVRGKRLCADLKSTLDASPEAFSKSVNTYRYHVQDALYRSAFAACGEPIDHFALIAVEKEAPYAVAVYTLDEDAVARGYAAARRNIETLSECIATGKFGAYGDGVNTLSLPRWAA